MRLIILFAAAVLCTTAYASKCDPVCFTIPDPSDQPQCECAECSCRGGACRECGYVCPCSNNPYHRSYVEEEVETEREPEWPSKMDAPFQDEVTR